MAGSAAEGFSSAKMDGAVGNLRHNAEVPAHVMTNFPSGLGIVLGIVAPAHLLVAFKTHGPAIGPFRKNATDDKASVASPQRPEWAADTFELVVYGIPAFRCLADETEEQTGDVSAAKKDVGADQFLAEDIRKNLLFDFLEQLLFGQNGDFSLLEA